MLETEEKKTATVEVPDYWGPFDDLKRSGKVFEAINYQGMMAELNDTLFIDTSDIQYYLELAKEINSSILELGCGSGRVILQLAKEGHSVTGIDNSPDMLQILEQKLELYSKEVKERLTFIKGDILNFDLKQNFSLIIFPYSTLLLFTNPEDRKKIYSNALKHLEPGGRFVFDVPAPGSIEYNRILKFDLSDEVKEIKITAGIKCFSEQRIMLQNSFWEIKDQREDPYYILEHKKLNLFNEGELEDELIHAGFKIETRKSTLEESGTSTRFLYTCSPGSDQSYPLWHPYSPNNQMQNTVLNLVTGKGCVVLDDEGHEYIDASGGLWSVQCGLGNKHIIQTITRQLEKLSYATLFALRGNQPAVELAKKLVEITPRPIQWVYLTGSGSESVELSIKLARQYWYLKGHTDKNRIVYLDQSYHGTFFGSMGVTGLYPEKISSGPGLPRLNSISSPNANNCPQKMSFESYELACIEELDQLAKTYPNEIAAFIFEPILGSAGVVIPSQNYFSRLKEICHTHNILLIVDEIATGFGRTGSWFCCEHFDLHPDILLLSKGINSGYLPLGATLFSAEVGQCLLDNGAGIMHGSSHNGNPTCCAAALATIEVLEKDQLVQKSEEMGEYFKRGLEKVQERHCIRSVRGKGLMLGITLEQTDGRLASQEQVIIVYQLLKRKGVLAYPSISGLVFLPALIITKEQINTIIQCLSEVLIAVELADDKVGFTKE